MNKNATTNNWKANVHSSTSNKCVTRLKVYVVVWTVCRILQIIENYIVESLVDSKLTIENYPVSELYDAS